MNRRLPSGPSGQAIAVLLLLLVLVLLWRVVFEPLADFYQSRQAELDQRELLARHVEALAAALPQLTADPRLAAPPPRRTIEGATDAVAAAALQGRLQELALQAGVRLGSVEILAGEPAGSLRRIGVRAALTGADAAVVRLLAMLAEADPPILVDDLQLHGNVTANPANAAQPGSHAPWLDASFTAYGFRDGSGGRQP